MRSREKKRHVRLKRLQRRTLVHCAGCTHQSCRWLLEAVDIAAAQDMGLRIPRSLRGLGC